MLFEYGLWLPLLRYASFILNNSKWLDKQLTHHRQPTINPLVIISLLFYIAANKRLAFRGCFGLCSVVMTENSAGRCLIDDN